MDTTNNSKRLHPLVAAAAVSVMLVSLVGVAAITGLLPDSRGDAPAVAALTTPAEETKAAPEAEKAEAKKETPAPTKSASAQASHKAYVPRPASTSQQRNAQYNPPVVVASVPAICESCGRVESVQAVQGAARPTGLGAVAGGVVGGLLGNQVGGGSGRKVATVAGVIGGGFAGNEIEKRNSTTYQVRVRMENGVTRSFPYDNQPPWNVGDRIRVVDGYLTNRS